MRDRDIDRLIKQAAQETASMDPALPDRIAKSLGPALRPVRPLPPAWFLSTCLFLAGAAVALLGATRAGLHGIEKMNAFDRVLIFPAVGLLLAIAAASCIAEMIPGSRRRIAPGALLAAACVALLAVFAILFHDYRTERFVAQGIVCLTAGLLHAIPAGLFNWMILRRGFAVSPVSAGLAAGTLASLAGVGMLELHCANFEAPHVMVWHVAVIPVCAAVGALLGWFRTIPHFRRG